MRDDFCSYTFSLLLQTINRERRELDIEGFDEQKESHYRFVFVSNNSSIDFCESVKSPWKEIYNVDLEINYKDQFVEFIVLFTTL